MKQIPVVYLNGNKVHKGRLYWRFDDKISINDIIGNHTIMWENFDRESYHDYPIKIEANYYDAKTEKKYYLINFCDALGY